MINECNSEMSHQELIDYLATYLRRNRATVWTEFRLPNRRRADIFNKCTDGVTEIYECKTRLGNYEYEQAMAKYLPYCHRLYIAGCAMANSDGEWLTRSYRLGVRTSSIGLVLVDRCDYRIRQIARTRPVDASYARQVLDACANQPYWNTRFGGQLVPMTTKE